MNLQALAQFHFLHPELLLLLPGPLLVYWFVRRREDARQRWKGLIAGHLLEHLLVGRREGRRLRPVHLVAAVLLAAIVAAAGPAWERELPPFAEETAPMVVVLQLSQSMDAIDVAPTRLERAKQKVRDLVRLRPGARTGLFVYGATAHLVLPLTDDGGLMETFLAALSTDLLPVDGDNPAAGLAAVERLLEREEAPGTIVFLTGGIGRGAAPAFRRHRETSDDAVIVLGFGTSRGGPIRVGENRFLTDSAGRRVMARLDAEALRRFGEETGVPVLTATVNDDDVEWVARRAQSHLEIVREETAPERWHDAGYYLTFPVALLAALWFRRGWTIRWSSLAILVALIAGPNPAAAQGFHWMDLFLTADQQGRYYFERGDYATAAERFEDPMWKGIALYRAGEYEAAVDEFAGLDSAEAQFLLGNCYARLGDYPAAVAAYDDALARRPEFPEAEANRALVAALIPKEPEDEREQQGEPTFTPDEVKFDEKGKKGKAGEIEEGLLSEEDLAEIWMRNIQVSPAGFLRWKFLIQAEREKGR